VARKHLQKTERWEKTGLPDADFSRTPPVCRPAFPGGFCYFWATILQPEC
jgi:hypothetical protein